MSLKYEPASLPHHISVKWLFLNRETRGAGWGQRLGGDSARLLLHRHGGQATFTHPCSCFAISLAATRSTPARPACRAALAHRRGRGGRPCRPQQSQSHPGGNPGANIKSISHRCHLFEVAFDWELTKKLSFCPWVASRAGIEEPLLIPTWKQVGMNARSLC